MFIPIFVIDCGVCGVAHALCWEKFPNNPVKKLDGVPWLCLACVEQSLIKDASKFSLYADSIVNSIPSHIHQFVLYCRPLTLETKDESQRLSVDFTMSRNEKIFHLVLILAFVQISYVSTTSPTWTPPTTGCKERKDSIRFSQINKTISQQIISHCIHSGFQSSSNLRAMTLKSLQTWKRFSFKELSN